MGMITSVSWQAQGTDHEAFENDLNKGLRLHARFQPPGWRGWLGMAASKMKSISRWAIGTLEPGNGICFETVDTSNKDSLGSDWSFALFAA
jgi:hypothetical protein